MSGSGISWARCKSAPRSRQIITPAPHNSVFYRPDALPATQTTASEHWRQNEMTKNVDYCLKRYKFYYFRKWFYFLNTNTVWGLIVLLWVLCWCSADIFRLLLQLSSPSFWKHSFSVFRIEGTRRMQTVSATHRCSLFSASYTYFITTCSVIWCRHEPIGH